MTSRPRSLRLKPRKSPAQARSAGMVALLLEAAARVLEERGFAGYTTNAVAERAGVSIGSLYQYFPGKEALTAALIERETAIFLGEAAATEELADHDEALRRFIAACVAHQMRRPALARLLDFEEGRLPLDQQAARKSTVLTATLLRHLEGRGALGARERQVATDDVLAIVKGMVDAAGERGETDAAALEARVVRAVLGYLGQP